MGPTRREALTMGLGLAAVATGLSRLNTPDHQANAQPTNQETFKPEPFLSYKDLEAKLTDIQSRTPGSTLSDSERRIKEGIAYLDETFDTSGGKLGIQSPTSGFELPRGQWIFWTNLEGSTFPTRSDRLTMIEGVHEFYGAGASIWRTVVTDGTLKIPTPGRAIRISADIIANPTLPRSPERDLDMIARETSDPLQRIEKAVKHFDREYKEGKILTPEDGTLPAGEWLIYMNMGPYIFSDVKPYLDKLDHKFDGVPGFVIGGGAPKNDPQGFYGFFRASILNQKSPIRIPIATGGRAIKLGTSISEQTFAPKVLR